MKSLLALMRGGILATALVLAGPSVAPAQGVTDDAQANVTDIGITFLCVTDSLKNCSTVLYTRQPWHVMFEVTNFGKTVVQDWSFHIELIDLLGNRIPVKTQVPGPPILPGAGMMLNWESTPRFDESQKGGWTVLVRVEIKDPGNPDMNPGNNERGFSFVVENKPMATDIGVTALCVTDSLKTCTTVVYTMQPWHILFDVTNFGDKPVLDWSFHILLSRPGQTPIPIKSQVPGPPLDIGETHPINWPAPMEFSEADKGTWEIEVRVEVKEPSNPDINPDNDAMKVPFVVENKELISDLAIVGLCAALPGPPKECTGVVFVEQPWHVMFDVVNLGEKPVIDWSFDIVLSDPSGTEVIPLKTQVPGPILDVGETVTINWEDLPPFDPTQKGAWLLDVRIMVKEPGNPDADPSNNQMFATFQVENKPQFSDLAILGACAALPGPPKECSNVVFVEQPWHVMFDVANVGQKAIDNWSFDILLIDMSTGTMIPLKTQVPGPILDVGETLTINWDDLPVFDPTQKGGWQVEVIAMIKDPSNPDADPSNNQARATFLVENKALSDIAVAHACVTRASDAGVPECIAFFDQAEFHDFNLSQGKAMKGIETFEEGTVTAKTPFPAPLGPDPSPPAFPNGLEQTNLLILDNITPGPSPPDVNPSGWPAALFAIPPGFEGSNSIKVGEDLFLIGVHASLDLVFTEPNHTGVGFRLSHFANYPQGGWSVAVYNKANGLLGEFEVPGDGAIEPSKAFFGVWCSETIGRINIYDKAGVGPDAIDDIEMWMGGEAPKQCADTIYAKHPWHVMFEVANVGEKPVVDWSFDITLSRPGGVPIPLKTQVPGPPLGVGQSTVINWPSPRTFTPDDKGPWEIEVVAIVKDPTNPDGDPSNNDVVARFEVANHPLTDVGEPTPTALEVRNVPNPFEGTTAIRFDLPYGGVVSLDVFDPGGRLMKRLANAPYPAGSHSVTWDGTNRAGRRLPPGVYLYRLTIGEHHRTRHMVLMN